MVTLQTIVLEHPTLFELLCGQVSTVFDKVTPPEQTSTNSICFLSHSSQLALLGTIQSPLLIVTKALWQKHSAELSSFATQKSAAILGCEVLQIGMAHILKYFDRREDLMAFPKGVSPQAWVHPTAQLGRGVTIAPFTSIGPNVQIGDHCVIGPSCIIEGEVRIGAHTLLEGNTFVGRQCRIGEHCRIKPLASIGSDGFGYAPTKDGALKIPQVGTVLIEDHVDIGSGTCIDRATITQTRIGRGTKIDNLVHIAHNCDIGQYCFLTAGFAIAGSSKIGDFFMTGGTSAVGDHVVIHEKVTLAGASVVTSNIDKSGSYGGNPVQPMQDYLKTRSVTGQLPQMRKQIHRIMKHLGLNE